MAERTRPAPTQAGLFGECAVCPTLANLPLIVDPLGSGIEVLAPGSVYQPLLLSRHSDQVEAGPGKLDTKEEAFISDLIRFLYPKRDYPRSEKTPLAWEGRDIWLKRNIEREPNSFRLRVDDFDWFYPDFIVWILDWSTKTQTFGFVDPKGLRRGAEEGWSDYKIVSTLYMPHVVELKLAERGQKIVFDGEEWTFRVRGVLVSTTSFADLKKQAKFKVHNEAGQGVTPDEADFNRGRITFQEDRSGYIQQVLQRLVEDQPLDRVLQKAAALRHGKLVADDETGFELALRMAEAQAGEAGFVGRLIEDYLRPDSDGIPGAWARANRRNQLLEYAHPGVLGIGAEKALEIREHPSPCEELWRRKRMVRE